MLVAKQNNKLIDLREIPTKELVDLKRFSDYKCPQCGAPVIFRQGPKRRAHFSHLTPCDHYHTSESEKHRISKEVLGEWLMTQGVSSMQIEYHLSEVNRIVDIYFEYKGLKYAFEIQKSMMAPELFKQRNQDYREAGVQAIWIFIGDIYEKKSTYLINQVMRLQKENRLLHFNIDTERFTFFENLVWLNQQEVEGMIQKIPLKQLPLERLLYPQKGYKKRKLGEWLIIKKEFRCQKYIPYQRKEYALLRMCAPLFINLSLLPSVVGWPIEDRTYEKPLFIWQAYVVLCIMTNYEEQDVFTLSEIRQKLRGQYHLKEANQVGLGLKKYLELLSIFGMIRESFGYYEYVRKPRLFSHLEHCLLEDEQLGKLWLEHENLNSSELS
ncbi:MAG: competence protein CoiA [Turicibacter sp.]|nr:competence protein CoiA [Turicibacter sp.]